MASIENMKNDLAECLRLSQFTSRPNIISLLTKEAERLKNLIAIESSKIAPTEKKTENRISVKISDYGWDQSDKFVKLYISLKNVHTLAASDVTSTCEAKSADLQARGLENKNYVFAIKNLLNSIVPAESYHKVKTDMICIFLKKENPQHWSHLTAAEKKSAEKKTPKMETEDDPGAGIMTFMKQMYDEGDDEMKRTIAKAWTEARDRKEPY